MVSICAAPRKHADAIQQAARLTEFQVNRVCAAEKS
jgi:hypothetical protein